MPNGVGIIKSPTWTTAFTARRQPRHPVKMSNVMGVYPVPYPAQLFTVLSHREHYCSYNYYRQFFLLCQREVSCKIVLDRNNSVFVSAKRLSEPRITLNRSRASTSTTQNSPCFLGGAFRPSIILYASPRVFATRSFLIKLCIG